MEDLNALYNAYGSSNFCLRKEDPLLGLVVTGYSTLWTSAQPDVVYSGTTVGSCVRPPSYPHPVFHRLIGEFFEGRAIICGGDVTPV